MNNHRYEYLYAPAARYLRRLPPVMQLLMLVGKVLMFVFLAGLVLL